MSNFLTYKKDILESGKGIIASNWLFKKKKKAYICSITQHCIIGLCSDHWNWVKIDYILFSWIISPLSALRTMKKILSFWWCWLMFNDSFIAGLNENHWTTRNINKQQLSRMEAHARRHQCCELTLPKSLSLNEI